MNKNIRYIKVSTVSAYEYFASASGSNNRQWMKRYVDMTNLYKALKKSKPDSGFLAGYEACYNCFHERENILHDEKV